MSIISLAILIINAAIFDAEARELCLPAGCEIARQTLWGYPLLRHLGAKILPRLRTRSVFVEPDSIAAFERECLKLLDDAATIGRATGYGSSVEGYFLNMLTACRIARRCDGTIHIG